MTIIIFECLFFLILLIALELLFIWIILLIRDGATDSSSKEEEKEDECEHEWEFMGFDNSKLSIGILQCIYQCKKCGKVISI
jgi:hypothetical protein